MTEDRIALLGGSPSVDRSAHRRWPEVTEDERRAVGRVLDRGLLSGATAPESVAFEEEFARFVGAKHAVLTHCGTSALHLAVATLGIGAGDHVIVPAYSFVATPLAVLHAGAIPLFADVDLTTGMMDPASVEAAMTSRTRAMMPVHVHGCPADLDALGALAAKRGIALVEDAAQAHGATYKGRPVGAIGQSGAFSLQSSKNLSAGEGGIFVTNDAALAEKANRLRNFGQDVHLADRDSFDAQRPLDGGRSLESLRIGWMYRGNEMMAAFARAQLARLADATARAQKSADRLARALSALPGVTPMAAPTGSVSVHHKFRVRLDPAAAGLALSPIALRNVLRKALVAEGLEVVLWQTASLPSQSTFQAREGFGGGWPWSMDRETDFARQYDPTRFPNTQRLLDGSLVLFSQSCPLIAQTAEMVDRYAEAFTRVWSRREALVAWAKQEGVADAAAE
jgi:dTDP-4-amino-4,6-dideoxygalactose transaminase